MFDHDKPHKRGTDLSPECQRYALAVYVHRFTRDHVPAWARSPRSDGTAYPVQFASDADWLANTLFQVTGTGRLKRALGADCYSRPTWPDGKPSTLFSTHATVAPNLAPSPTHAIVAPAGTMAEQYATLVLYAHDPRGRVLVCAAVCFGTMGAAYDHARDAYGIEACAFIPAPSTVVP